MVEYFTANGSTGQEAYENVLTQIGVENFIYNFNGVDVYFPTTWSTSALIFCKEHGAASTTTFTVTLGSVFGYITTSSMYTVYTYGIKYANSLSIAPTRTTSGGLYLIYFDGKVFVSSSSILGQYGGSENLIRISPWSYVTGSSSSSVACSCFIVSPSSQVTNIYLSERCITFPLIYVGGFKDEFQVIPNFCVLNTATRYPIGTTFEYNNATWELLGAPRDSYNNSVLCRKVTV